MRARSQTLKAPALAGVRSGRAHRDTRVGVVALVGAAAILVGLLIGVGRGSTTSLALAAGIALIPTLLYLAIHQPAAAAGLFIVLQLTNPAQVQTPAGTVTPAHTLLLFLLFFQFPAFVRAYKESPRVRTGVLLLMLWLATFILRFSYESAGSVLRDFITNAGFVAVTIVGIGLARVPGTVRNVAAGAAIALIVLGICGMLASLGIIPHPTRQWHPEFAPRSLIGIPSPFTRNYGLNLVFDSVATLLPLCFPYLMLVAARRGTRGRTRAIAALAFILFAIIFVFQSRDMLVQAFVAFAALLVIRRPRLGIALIVFTIPYAVYAVGHLEAVDQTSSTLRKADLQIVASTALNRPQAYLFGTDEEKVARDAAAGVGLSAALANDKDTNIHSFFLESLVANGWASFLLLIAFYVYSALCAYWVYRARPRSLTALSVVVAMPQMLFTITLEPVAAQIVGSWLLAGFALGGAGYRTTEEVAESGTRLAPGAPLRRRESRPPVATRSFVGKGSATPGLPRSR
jgi:hypothetical protein